MSPPPPEEHPETQAEVPPLEELASLLRRRLDLIADHAWRDRDPEAHLDALREVSEQIEIWHRSRPSSQLPPRLRHFLASASYQKALAWIEESASRDGRASSAP